MDADPTRYTDDSIDFADLFARLGRGFIFICGLTLLSLALGAIVSIISTNKGIAVSTLRVTFAFPGFEKGVYPGGTKFSPEDVRAPDNINEAIKRLGLTSTPNLASQIRGAISISGFVSPHIIKERDRLRAAGQSLPPYFPDEYEISVSLPQDFPLNVRQRELLLTEIVNIYSEKFRQSYVELPPGFGNAFSSLRNADYVEYELVLNNELESITGYLSERMEKAKQFRSPTTNLSFQDLMRQTELFRQIRLNDVLGLIYINGLSKDRKYALLKMDYYLRTLEDQERRVVQEEKVVTDLLNQTQGRAQNYVLATKTQHPQNNQPLLDQGFIDTLLANDAYNFLIRRALDAGLEVKRIQASKARLLERRQRMESFIKGEFHDQAEAIASTQQALGNLEISYNELVGKVRDTLAEYARQEFGNAVRITMQAQTPSNLRNLAVSSIIGGCIGLFGGLGLSLLNLVPARTLDRR